MRASPPLQPAALAILLCTCNGQRFLPDQLDSISGQTVDAWRVWVSDDGSRDDTVRLLEEYRRQWGGERLTIRKGPGKGFAANFLSLACAEDIQAEYYAFADQDDVWDPDKLSRALAWLQSIPAGTPALYCARTRLIDAAGEEIGLSPLFPRPPGFANALVQSIAGGNTMVFNNAARELLRQAGGAVEVVTHDWWAYLLVSGCGGVVHYDPEPTVRYRQHGANLVGANSGWISRLARIPLLLSGRYGKWNDINLMALRGVFPMLTPENQRMLEEWAFVRRQPLVARLATLQRTGIHRQTMAGNLGLLIATVFRRI